MFYYLYLKYLWWACEEVWISLLMWNLSDSWDVAREGGDVCKR